MGADELLSTLKFLLAFMNASFITEVMLTCNLVLDLV